jgi:hypothetical protein
MIKYLKYFTVLSLSYCIELETLTARYRSQGLNLNRCILLKTPPIEITVEIIPQQWLFRND